MVVINKKGQVKLLKKAPTNKRSDRVRPQSNQKADGSSLAIADSDQGKKGDFAKTNGEYGDKWGEVVHGDIWALPTFSEMMDGIVNWLMEQTKGRMTNAKKQQQKNILKKVKLNFQKLTQAIDIQNTNTPMKLHSSDPELGLANPYSKVTCFILYLYSMELGSPPLYAELNRVARDMDLTQLRNLGPILRALTLITLFAESHRDASDKIMPGS